MEQSVSFWPYWLQLAIQMSGETEMNSINSNAPGKTCLSRGFNHFFTFFWPYWLQFTVQMSGETEMNSINSNALKKTCLSRGLNHLFTFFFGHTGLNLQYRCQVKQK